MGKSTTNAMSYEGMTRPKLTKKQVKNLTKQTDIEQMDTLHILLVLFGRHYKLLVFTASISLNVLYFVKHYALV